MSYMSIHKQHIKPIAIVLPQFHPIPENDIWWGEGFTEWRNVVKAKPRFRGHYQPHLPKHLGYYDLRLAETREAQAELARQYGIYGFCYYHYWFSGRRILEKPVDAILESGKPDFPFMLCWANENWTRTWDGGADRILLEQNYSIEDFVRHARHLLPYFRDARYIRISNKPVFAIYKDAGIENLSACLNAFREELHHHGIDVFICRFERRLGTSPDAERAYKVFNAGIEFQPLTRRFDEVTRRVRQTFAWTRSLDPRAYVHWLWRRMGFSVRPPDHVYDYQFVIDSDLTHDFQQGKPIFPGVSPGWDNSPRRTSGGALILLGSTPEKFGAWVERKIESTDWSLLPQPFMFVNAWNEWAESNHIEPCEKWGLGYLEALRDALERTSFGGASA